MARILIVDDSNLMRGLLKDHVLKMGHEIVGEASEGNEALRLIQELQPDIIFLDIILPGVIGLDILKIVNSKYPNISVIINSVLEDPLIKKEALQSGAIDYIAKPYTSEKIYKALSFV